ncbi:MAG TPA: c(7)-type cytochrome triheme domain-containing protein [Geobacteraceae bacterium]
MAVRKFLTGRVLPICFTIAATLCLTVIAAGGIERYELGKVLGTIPPNGPPEHYGNVTLRKKSVQAGMPPVVFPHWAHRARYTCRVCHYELQISQRRNDTGISRAANLAGHYCGACHNGKTAFSVKDEQPRQCERCHMKSLQGLDARFRAFAANLPAAELGNGIDWARALDEGDIQPQNTLSRDYAPLPLPENLQKPLKLETTSPRSDVTFSHEEHYAELDCSSCHPEIFNIKKKGTEAFSMDKNIFGRFCGTCHMRVAFPMNDCHRCHAQISNNW